jgi:hypothetical protein
MPNFDGGHYFLTALIPIATDTLVEHHGRRVSPIQAVRKTLATLPTALQTRATEKTGLNSPFSRNHRTHFARFVVIEDVMYNARDPVDAIRVALTGSNPVTPQPQDALSNPFLLFVADFDAANGEASELTSYLETLWKTMEAELREVFSHCVGFEGIDSGETFAHYIQRGQIETTMPFNDYWTISPPLQSYKKLFIGIPVALAAVGLIGGWTVTGSFWMGLGAALAGSLGGLAADYAIVMLRGAKPFPPAPNADLPSVLKALYLQQRFIDFAIETQGASDEVLHQKFARFVADHQPSAPTPTQHPGVIKS